MPFIQVELTTEEDQILADAAKLERRSKNKQLAHSAIENARAIIAGHSSDHQPSSEPEKEEVGA